MLKNVLIVVDDIEKSIEFYKDLFGLQVILQNEGNVILSEGLVLQDAGLWGKTLDEISTPFNNRMELYFEEFDIDHLKGSRKRTAEDDEHFRASFEEMIHMAMDKEN